MAADYEYPIAKLRSGASGTPNPKAPESRESSNRDIIVVLTATPLLQYNFVPESNS